MHRIFTLTGDLSVHFLQKSWSVQKKQYGEDSPFHLGFDMLCFVTEKVICMQQHFHRAETCVVEICILPSGLIRLSRCCCHSAQIFRLCCHCASFRICQVLGYVVILDQYNVQWYLTIMGGLYSVQVPFQVITIVDPSSYTWKRLL